MAIERPDRTASSFPGDVPGKGMLGPLQRYMFLRAGMVTRVDNENYRLDIMWLGGEDGDSGRIERMVTFANWGPRTWFGAMPETGGIAICGYLKWGRGMQTVSTDPVVLTFMPAGYKTGHNFDIIQRYENEYGEKPWSKRTWVEQRRYRQMKLYPGEAGIGSSEASDLRMDEDVVIYNKRLNELHLRAHDQAIVTKSLQRYECTEAGRRWEGMVTRNPATFTGSDRGEKKVPPQKYIMPPWGKKLYIIPIDQPNTIDDDPKNWPWVEVRRHVEEAGDAIMTVSEESEDLDWDEEKIAEEYWRFDMKGKKREACESWSEIESKHPLIEIVHGTLVGDDQFLDGEDPQWGMVLEPLLWSDWEEVLEDTKDQPDPQWGG